MVWIAESSGFRSLFRTICRVFVPAAALCLVLAVPVSAHPPASVVPGYDAATSTLSVTIIHQVPNPDGHYIGEIRITVNGVAVNSTSYSSQPSLDTFTRAFPLDVAEGDTVTVTAECNLAGSGSGQLIVGGDDGTTGGPASTQAAGWSLPVSALAACVMVFMVWRWKRP